MMQKKECQEEVEKIKKDFEEEQKSAFEITRDMTRQYKGMQEQLVDRITQLSRTVQELQDSKDERPISQQAQLEALGHRLSRAVQLGAGLSLDAAVMCHVLGALQVNAFGTRSGLVARLAGSRGRAVEQPHGCTTGRDGQCGSPSSQCANSGCLLVA